MAQVDVYLEWERKKMEGGKKQRKRATGKRGKMDQVMESQENLQDPSPPLSTEEADNLHRSCKKIKTNEEEGLIEDLTMDECPPVVNSDAPIKGVLEGRGLWPLPKVDRRKSSTNPPSRNKPWLQGLLDFTSSVKKWNHSEFGNVFLRKNNLIRRLEGIDRKLATSYHGGLKKLKSKIWKEYETILLQEELIWFQKSRNNWLLFGDRNTSFFHSSTLVRHSKNRIEALKDDGDNWVWDEPSLKQMV
ncbi:Retrovirus-related Pol polyprotein LINE-1 [Senna tora]|uniref:Retrovirus-related Pol polyprotein LINE-1 n=1 Tax=Senna tora TaxID=362788 RepID=A0A834TQE0_9FABA|nr:Retrovirus-related Pol polyprotein LINE-1 [Senna tora]